MSKVFGRRRGVRRPRPDTVVHPALSVEAALSGLIAARWFVLAAIVLVTAVVGAGVFRLEFNPDARVYFSFENPDRIALERLEAHHGRYGNVVLMLVPQSGDVFQPAVIHAVTDATERLAGLDGVAAVQSLTNSTALPEQTDAAGHGQGADGGGRDAEFLRSLWEWDTEPFAPFVSPQADVVALHLLIANSDVESIALASTLNDAIDAMAADHGGITYRISGDAIMDATFMEAIFQDMTWLAPLQGIAIVLLLLFCLRCVWTTAALLLVLGLATLLTMGIAGWAGFSLNGITSATPMILLGLAVATCIHLLTAWQQTMRGGGGRIEAFSRAIRTNAFPVFLAVFSTVVSFLCLGFSDSPPFRDLGVLVAVGLVLTGILAFTVLPMLVILLPTRTAMSRVRAEQAMEQVGRVMVTYPKAIVAILLALTVLAGLGITQLSFDDRLSHYFSERFEFRRDTDFMEKHFSGLHIIEYSLPAERAGGVATPEYLAAVERFRTWLERQPEVDRVADFASIARTIVERDPRIPSADGLPASFEVGQTVIRAFEEMAESDAALGRFVSAAADRSLVRIVLRNVNSSDIRSLTDRANDWLVAKEPLIASRAAGMSLLAANMSQRNAKGMFYGTVAALVLVSLILLGALRSVRLGLISLVPNLAPMLIAYGLWGAFVGEATFAATVVMAMTFGIVVDDTVHVLAKYSRLRREGRMSIAAALPESFRTVGVAVAATTFSIASGFVALALSGFTVNQQLGLLTLLVLFAALFTVLLLLPPLLVLFDRRERPA
jgi:hypothetical protein